MRLILLALALLLPTEASAHPPECSHDTASADEPATQRDEIRAAERADVARGLPEATEPVEPEPGERSAVVEEEVPFEPMPLDLHDLLEDQFGWTPVPEEEGLPG